MICSKWIMNIDNYVRNWFSTSTFYKSRLLNSSIVIKNLYLRSKSMLNVDSRLIFDLVFHKSIMNIDFQKIASKSMLRIIVINMLLNCHFWSIPIQHQFRYLLSIFGHKLATLLVDDLSFYLSNHFIMLPILCINCNIFRWSLFF